MSRVIMSLNRFVLRMSLLVLLSATWTPASARALLLPAETGTPAKSLSAPGVARARPVRLDIDALREIESLVARGLPARIEVAPFDDVMLNIEITSIERPRAETIAYHGVIDGRVDSSVVFVRTGDVVGMEAHLGERHFRVQYLGVAGFEAREMDLTAVPMHSEWPTSRVAPAGGKPNAHRESPSPRASMPGNAKMLEDGSAIDLLVVYTPKGRSQYGGTAGMESLIDTMVAGVNQVFANSLVNTRIRLVASAEINYVEQGDYTNQMGEIYMSYEGGPLRVVYDLRDAYSADLIAYISGDNTASACGAAPLFNEYPMFAKRDAVMAMVHFCANNQTMAHEIGHLMGIFHDRNNSPTNETVTVAGVVYTDNFGYVDTTNRFTDVMAYVSDCLAQGISCVRLPYFSSKSVNVVAPFNDAVVPIGNSVNNAANILDATRVAVANFRPHVDRGAGFRFTRYSVSEGGSVQLTLTRVGSLSLGTRVNWRTENGTALAGQDFLAASGSVFWAAGEGGDKTISVSVQTDALNEGNEHFGVSLSSDGALTNASADITLLDTANDLFPIDCEMPPGFTQAIGADAGWHVASDESAEGGCALKSLPIANGETAAISYTGMFAAGEIRFRRRVDSELGWDFFQFEIDGVAQGENCVLADRSCAGNGAASATASGATDWSQPGSVLSFPVSAGVRTITFRYRKDAECCAEGADAAWVDALFLPLAQNVAVTTSGPGTVRSMPSGIDCGLQCATSLPLDTPLMLTAIPDDGSEFAGWTGCPNFHGNQCFVLVKDSVSVVAAFSTVPRSITVSRNGAGNGTVGSVPAGIACGQDCSEVFDSGTVLTLTASPDSNSAFAGWSGVACLGGNSALVCTFAVSGNATVIATFNLAVTVPGAPLNPEAVPGDAEALISFTPPDSDGGSAITLYAAMCSPGSIMASGAASPILVLGLQNGTGYTCTISATNAIGAGPASLPTNSFIPAGTPAAPNLLSAQPIEQGARLTFSAPTSNGGAPILDYTASCSPGTATATANALSMDVVGLNNQVAYQCSVRARNAVGLSVASNALSVIPGSSGNTADLSISKSNGTTFIGSPGLTDYVITVANSGPAAVVDARVEDALDLITDFERATWTCTAFNGAACPASGTDHLDVRVDLPVNASVRFVLSASPNPASEAPVTNLASVTPPATITDPNPNNNVATDGPDRRGVFRNGFESPLP